MGADLLWSAIIRVPVLIREHPQEITYHFVSDAFFWMPMLLCAWGIFKWRLWSRKLGTVLSILSLAMLGILVSIEFQHAGPYRGGLLALALINCSVFVWLLLPVVRAEYLRRDQIA